MINNIVANKYLICEKIGNGSFGIIYKGKNIRTNEYNAIKVESINSKLKLLKNECIIYNYLLNTDGVPKIKWYGKDDYNYYMVLNLLGNSLQNIVKSKKDLSINIVLNLGIRTIEIIRNIHNKGLIHRDIKPDNFLFDLNENKLYLIDFGLCKSYLKNEKHIEIKLNKNLIGSYNFASINSHNYIELSRRDDLESIIYMLMYLYYGELKWQNYHNDDIKQKNLIIKNMKENLKNENVEEIFLKLLKHITDLAFDETPNYDYLLNLMKEYNT